MRKVFIIAILWFPLISMALMPIGKFYQPDTHAHMKALLVYQFATLVDWPKEYKQGDFNIGVFGESNLYNQLNTKYSNKTVGSQAIKIKKFSTLAEITQCHILYISPENSDKVGTLVKKYQSKSTLIVSDKEGKLKDGAIINFVIKDNGTSYELSKSNAAKAKLIVGAKLENLAARIE